MSATGRGGLRVANDSYPTPAWLTQAILPYLKEMFIGRTPTILEPACGGGAIVHELVLAWPGAEQTIGMVDIKPSNYALDIGAKHADFLQLWPKPLEWKAGFDLIITNPPYTLAEQFIRRALLWRRSSTSVVAMLLRLNFLESQKRAVWLRENTPSIYVTPRRPSFTGKGTDATGYAWFVWGPKPPTIAILETEKQRICRDC